MSMRLNIMQCIARDIVALDDIIAEIGGDAQKVRNNLQAARTDKLIASYVDDVTKRPAYKLTAAGREWLKDKAPSSQPQGKPKAQAEAGTEERMLREQIDLLRGERDELARQYGALKAAYDAYDQPICTAHQTLSDAGIGVGRIDVRVMDLVAVRNAHGNELDGIRQVLGKYVATGADPEQFEVIDLARKVAQLVIAMREQLGAAQDVKDAARGYLVRAPKRRPRILMKPESAVAAAMAAARNGSGRGDVYALVPVGSAVRGAQWVQV